MKHFKRVMKYICYTGIGNFLTGDIDEQTLIYEQLDWDRWVRRYIGVKRGRVSSGSIEESENANHDSLPAERIVSRFASNDISAQVLPSTSYGEKILVIRGAFDYKSDDALKDDFSSRVKVKDQMLEKLREAFDNERDKVQHEIVRLNTLLKRYEHLPIKG